MPNTAHTLLSRNSVPRRLKPPDEDTTLRSVRQDKPLPSSAPHSLPAASPSQKSTAPLNIRTQKQHLVKLYIWTDQSEKNELKRVADSEGLSLSQTGRAIIVDGLRQRLRIEREALSQPVIETTIRKYFSRMIFFLARIAFDLGVIKGLMIWLCRRVAGANKEQVDTVIHQSRERARKSMTTLTPELATVMEDLKKILQQEEGS